MKSGDIFWVHNVPDPQGNNPKDRPVFVFRDEKEGVFLGAFCSASSALTDPLPRHFVPIPHHTEGMATTKLSKPTVVICDWWDRFTAEDVYVNKGGHVDDSKLVEDLQKLILEIEKKKRADAERQRKAQEAEDEFYGSDGFK